MTDTPDLRTLAAEPPLWAIVHVEYPDDGIGAVLRRYEPGWTEPGIDPDAPTFTGYHPWEWVCRLGKVTTLWPLAAVLPAHRRQVPAEAADALEQLLADAMRTGRENAGLDAYAGASQVAEWLRRLASAAPETVPSPRHDDETAPAVGREAARAQRATEGGDWVPLAEVLDALWDRARELRQLFRTGEYGIEYVNGWEAAHDFIDARFAAPQGADEGNDRG